MIKNPIRLVGLGLGAIFLVWSISLTDWDIFAYAIASITPEWVALGAASLLLSMLLRSLRWHLLTGLPYRDWSNVWEATCIGYLGTAIYPARAGDVMRMIRLQQLTGLGGGLAMGSGVMDRIVEGLGLGCLLVILLLAWDLKLEAQQGLWAIVLLFAVAAILAAAFIAKGDWLRNPFQRLSHLGNWGVRLHRWYEESLSGLQVLRSPKRLLLTFAIQSAVSALDILGCWLLAKSFGWSLPISGAVVVLVYVAAAACLPASPGYVGMYQVAAIFALKRYGIDESSSVAYGTLLQVLTLFLFVGSGLWAVAKQRLRDRAKKTS